MKIRVEAAYIPSSGYQWISVPPEDEAIEDSSYADLDYGATCRRTYVYHDVSPGTVITLQLKRPWDQEAEPEDEIRVHVG